MYNRNNKVLRYSWLDDRKDNWATQNLCYVSPKVLLQNKWKNKPEGATANPD